MTQLNTPYPATAYLKAYLDFKKINCEQRDFGIDLINKMFTADNLKKIKAELLIKPSLHKHESVNDFLSSYDRYESTIESVIQFLQGKDLSLALRISSRQFLPESRRFEPLNKHSQLMELFGTMGTQDRAKYIASLYLDDLADVLNVGIDKKFEFSRYGEKLASSQNSFDLLYSEVKKSNTLIDTILKEITEKYVTELKPDILALTTPFPGNVYGALKISYFAKKMNPKIKTVMGGGFVNTELRNLSDKRFFEFIDYLVFDDGERALECVIEHEKGLRSKNELLRTWFLENKKIKRVSSPKESDVPFKNISAPTYKGLDLNKYISMIEMPNPMYRLWSDYKWNKLILAHGCYWRKCTFCDISLDYIQRFEPQKASQIVDNMETMIRETGLTGFHFVDEAAPPALLKQISLEIIKRKLSVTWWGNIRFDSLFDSSLTKLMMQAGCIAVTGGLEVASPRLLKLINKGITLEQVFDVTKNFKKAGIYVHAYLMYGYPTQTVQETIDSLEIVRKLFKNKCLDSGHWHRFVATIHSPVGIEPKKFKVKTFFPDTPKKGLFAVNEIPFYDPLQVDHDELGKGLRFALYNYMHGIGLDADVREWFDINVPKPQYFA